MTIHTKEMLFTDFRRYAGREYRLLRNIPSNKNGNAQIINRKIKNYAEDKLSAIKRIAASENWNNTQLLDKILRITYVANIVMLEYRNKVWPYDYMTFTRRIGELWEPFCKLAFEYPNTELSIIPPPKFEAVKTSIQKDSYLYIQTLPLKKSEKDKLMQHYAIPWEIVNSGGIKLDLDLHFEKNGVHYNCDFKSGFSSNEKGNTNRLLLVGSIYQLLSNNERMLLLIRQNEDENNHYLQTLINSKYWTVYCADECYAAIERFTGFNVHEWLEENADWDRDIGTELREHLRRNNLLRYLTW